MLLYRELPLTVMFASSQMSAPGGRRDNHRAAEHEHRAVEHAAHDHPARLRRAVGRKLQHERGGQTAQKEG